MSNVIFVSIQNAAHTPRGQKYVLKKKKKARILKITDNTKPILVFQMFPFYIQSPPTQNVTDRFAGWLSILMYSENNQKAGSQMKNRKKNPS